MAINDIRVLVVDDQPMFRAGIAAILNAQPDITIVGEAVDGGDAVAQARMLTPDVVLMDVRMPRMDGVEATRALTALGDGKVPRVIMLTTFDVEDYLFDALRAGASGFMLKDANPDELTRAVRTVHAGDSLLDPRVTTSLIEAFVMTAPRRAVAPDALGGLTGREREVFLLIAEGRSNKEIAAALFIAEQTAKTHVSRILTKLQLRDRVHAVMFGYESGLITPGLRSPALRRYGVNGPLG